MYKLTRVDEKHTKQGRFMRIRVDAPAPGSKDGGFVEGGDFLVEPGQTIHVSDEAADAILGDPAMAKEFTSEPRWKAKDAEERAEERAAEDGEQSDAAQADEKATPRAKTRRSASRKK